MGTISTRGFLVICVSGVCGGKLNSKFSSRVAAIASISIILNTEINVVASMRRRKHTRIASPNSHELLQLSKIAVYVNM